MTLPQAAIFILGMLAGFLLSELGQLAIRKFRPKSPIITALLLAVPFILLCIAVILLNVLGVM